MARETDENIPLSLVNPQYLHANSTSHTWAFSAIAELIDNACDPDVGAKQIWIDWTKIKDFDCLTFTDNGAGMDFDEMHKMLSFGFSDKQALGGRAQVGLYGNGFKSGSMFLGKDAIVFSKNPYSMIVGLLSQTYLADIQAQNVVVPIVTFRKNEENKFSAIPQHRESLKAILEHSLFQTEEQLLSELKIIKGITGTRIIIWNLRSTSSGQIEFEFKEDIADIQIPYVDSTDEQRRPIRRPAWVAEFEFSLRAYCSILYLKPSMQILIKGKKMKTQLVAKSLAHTVKDRYTPKFLNKHIKITFGYRTESGGPYGVLMYCKNRLIRPYVHLGCQLKANAKGVGVIGIIECNFLKPTHNKQEFAESVEYRKIKHCLGVKLEEYWNHMRLKRKEHPSNTGPTDDTKGAAPDQTWVQCNECLKWRKLAGGIDPDSLPYVWVCHMNEDPKFRRCWLPEEPENSEEEQPHEKQYKQQKRKLITQENKEGKRAKKIGHQNDTSEAVASTAASALCLPTSPVTATLDENSMQVQTATLEGDQCSEKVETVKQERDQHSYQGETVIQERNQCSEQVETVKQERDQHSYQGETVIQERNQCSEQVETVKQERDQHSEQVETVIQEGDKYREQMETVTQERDLYREQVKTVFRGRDRYRNQVKAVTQERDPYREQVKTVTQMRDQYREQMETATHERDQYREQVKTVIRGRDRYRNQVKAVTQERNEYREQVEAVTEEREQYREQMETATHERDQYREQVKTVTQMRDQYREQMETVTQERDQYREQVKAVIRARDRYRNQVKAVSQERNEYREQVEAVTEERDQYREQMETVTQERDLYREQVKTINQERDQYKTKPLQLFDLQKLI
ncbi:MORC family CW-type zinc finger protein 3-like isoform X4 [Anguilla anguilla]|uniref:MORC family CW-type zinc finger protein 3-like isoform X4 n=1 Tax=Anguilla anguilla TaxID=7936 RepID=UPI0015AABC9E|nr:MORC family CW-type zinc finger protein 3-like isoform X4 [Anguilla anguilla]